MMKRIIKGFFKGIAILIASVILIIICIIVWTFFLTGLKPYDDARFPQFMELRLPNVNMTHRGHQYNENDIFTYTFTSNTTFKGSEELAESYLISGRNPGLGIKKLHEQGITGEGVRVAIIDQDLALTHPEYKERIVEYHEFGKMPAYTSMHGPAVASLLVGKESGTAPGALLYYAGAPSWTGDSQYKADALLWIIEENAKLPEGDKIRVVSVSAAPSGQGSPFIYNTEQWDKAVAEAIAEGILVLDCRIDSETGIIAPAYFNPNDPDDITHMKPFFPAFDEFEGDFKGYSYPQIFVPTSFRAFAMESEDGSNDWMYTGQGGLSWGIPYAAGVLAMGWQIDTNLSNDEIVQLLLETAYIDDRGYPYINPTGFIEAIMEKKQK